MEDIPKFLQGIIPFAGAGYDSSQSLAGMNYTVPSTKRCQTIYFRAGNSCDELIVLVTTVRLKPGQSQLLIVK